MAQFLIDGNAGEHQLKLLCLYENQRYIDGLYIFFVNANRTSRVQKQEAHKKPIASLPAYLALNSLRMNPSNLREFATLIISICFNMTLTLQLNVLLPVN